MKVRLRNPDRTLEVAGPKLVADVLRELDIVPEAVLVIRDSTLLTRDERVEECPMVEGNTQHRYKEAMTKIEESSPGTKQQFLFGFYKKGAPHEAHATTSPPSRGLAKSGAPTVRWGDEEARCSFCKMKALALSRKQAGYVPDGKSRRRGRRPHPPARAAEGSPEPR